MAAYAVEVEGSLHMAVGAEVEEADHTHLLASVLAVVSAEVEGLER